MSEVSDSQKIKSTRSILKEVLDSIEKKESDLELLEVHKGENFYVNMVKLMQFASLHQYIADTTFILFLNFGECSKISKSLWCYSSWTDTGLETYSLPQNCGTFKRHRCFWIVGCFAQVIFYLAIRSSLSSSILLIANSLTCSY